MKKEYTEEDFARAIPNPFFHDRNKIVRLAVKNETYAIYEEIAKENDVSIEYIMQRALASYGKMLQEAE